MRNLAAWAIRIVPIALGAVLLSTHGLDAGTYSLGILGGTIRSDVPGVWYVIGGHHISYGIGSITCSSGTIHVAVDGDADGWGSATPDSVYASLGYIAGMSISTDEWRINVFDRSGNHVDMCAQQPTGSDWRLMGVVPQR